MVNTKFEAYKIKRELLRSGKDYLFKRYGVNEFGEQNETVVYQKTVRGLYHEQNSSIAVKTSDATQIRNKKIPMILCLYDNDNLKINDFVIINNKTFKVTGVTNIQEWNIICDISLEVVDNGD